jgi:hypothetical protein
LLSVGFIEGAIGPSIEAIDLYLPGIVNVIQGVQSPIVAINSIDYGT